MRLDKWLWAARFYKTRSLAQQAIEAGRVRLEGERIKPSKEVKPGDRLAIRVQDEDWEIAVRALSERRGPAAAARLLYEEAEQSRLARETRRAQRSLAREPALERHGRPTKTDRRALRRLRGY
ncbi:MAG TPA: RNA-binding S4 domain-containing protein [Burkholderiales bacterium]|nr:RNA-binding S4 domain-containing protein [Burkholderiales bacterium]